ncbi:MAG: response regulator transcription factor [Phycisphaerales bacterium JB050]
MNAEQQTVYVVDDDAAMHKILRRLVGSVGLRVETFGSASEFLDVASPHTVGCAILDVRMPGMSGLDLQRELRERRVWLPVIVVSGHADVSMAVRAMKGGAYDFIEKPFNDHELLEKVQKALEFGEQVRQTEQRRQLIDDRIATLTPRERQVMEMVVNGMANKQVAAELGLSEKTIEVHRKHVMDKMQAGNVADLIRMAMRASTIQAID